MVEVSNDSVKLIITSPSYFNIKDYSSNGTQDKKHSEIDKNDIGSIASYDDYINAMLNVWRECERAKL